MEITQPDTQPLVTAVIPTRNRPGLVCRAVRSALAQTYPNLEVVVVVDGPDPATVEALEQLHEPRVRIVALEENVGGSEARNIGVSEAKGEWIALLDDDDEWKEKKTERQLRAILQKPDALFSATQYYVRQGGRFVVRPRRFPEPAEHISEYLFCHLDWIGRRTTFLQTSTWVIERRFALSHPFSRGLKRYQDTDWLLRVFSSIASHASFLREPLALFDNECDRKRISTTCDWRYLCDWADSNSGLFTEKALPFFFISACGREVALQQSGIYALRLLWSKCDPAARRTFDLCICLAQCSLRYFVSTMKLQGNRLLASGTSR